MSYDHITELLEAVGATDLTTVTDVRGAPGAFRIIILRAGRRKVRILLLLLGRITVRDMTCGKYYASDPDLLLHIRGSYGRTPLIVTVPFHERSESEQADLITASIEAQQPYRLVRQLVAIEEHREVDR